MQGGRTESSVLGRWGRFGARGVDSAESSGYESEVEVSGRISLGVMIDDFIHVLRTGFAVAISLPIAWITLHPTIGAFRQRKFRMVEVGTKTVVEFQRRTRCKFLDVYFQCFSFCAEEEFYLLVLPFTIWNVDHVLGRRYVYLATAGLLIGNVMKDVFGLPRPASPPVWRPSHQESIDSTNLQDFGFPSTHAMNAISNSVYTLLYFTTTPSSFDIHDVVNPSTYKWLLVCLWYIFSLSLSRLYLGAHSPTDIRGGIALGIIWVAVYFASSEIVDEYYLTTPALVPKMLLLTIVTLLLNPQPRPPTPTFIQNSLICGLIMGCALGNRHYYDLQGLEVSKDRSSVSLGTGETFGLPSVVASMHEYGENVVLNRHPYVATIMRTIIGYAVVLILRVLAKNTIVAVLGLVGISTKPKIIATEEKDDDSQNDDKDSDPNQKRRRKRRRKHHKVVRLLTRDIDIVGNAIVKVFTYTVLAWSITFFVPVLHCIIGLAKFQKESSL